jgi:uroporphyrinogen decarboxylase
MGMTSKERMVVAMRNGQPDRVPVSPDISNMIPCRLTGKPFWDVYYNQDPPLWRAYIEAVRYFEMDGWFIYGAPDPPKSPKATRTAKLVEQRPDRWIARITWHTPEGDLEEVFQYPIADSESVTEKMVKDLERDWPKLKYIYHPDNIGGMESFELMKREAGDTCAVGGAVDYPLLPYGILEDELLGAAMLYYERPELAEDYRAMFHAWQMARLERMLEAKPDFMLLHGSGSITMQSPDIFDAFSLPSVVEMTRACKAAGVPSILHSCGKERHVIERCAERTDLDCVNPLEEPPMGDCTLKEIKDRFGTRFALMGNLNTTTLMLTGTPEQVAAASRKAIDDAGAGGGFILSTGDQCGRDTPDENIRAMIRTARTYGVY